MRNSPANVSLEKSASRGNPSFVWRAGQERRLEMIRSAAGPRQNGKVFENGCGIGMYLSRLAQNARQSVGLDIELERVITAHQITDQVLCGVGERLPFPDNAFDLILSHEVLEHVQDDRQSVEEMVRVLQPGGRAVIFVPNRGYPFETHGIYWRGAYHFGNAPLVNYLPTKLRDRLAPHVRVYTRASLERLFAGLPVRFIQQTVIFGAYDNIIARWGFMGRLLRLFLQTLEKTPLRLFGLSHFWVIEKI